MQGFHKPTHDDLMRMAIDIADPRLEVEVQSSEEGDRLWINVDGVCILRIQRIGSGKLKLPTNKENGSSNG